MSDRYRPFHCGSQFADWEEANCCRCVKYDNIDSGMKVIDPVSDCEIFNALIEACCDDGTVSADIAQRMGYLDNKLAFQWKCPEVVWTEAWKAEWRERNG